MKRNPRKLKWTKAFRKAAGKEMMVDTTLQFAARRNIPVRYNRDLVAKTLAAMHRVSEIRARRERVFYKKRMAGNRKRELETARKLVETHSHLLPKIRGSVRKKMLEVEQKQGRTLTQEEVKELEKEVVAERKMGRSKKTVLVQKYGEDGEVEYSEEEEEEEEEEEGDEMEYEMDEEGVEVEVGEDVEDDIV
jgi:large subunit ribosomal protein L24e